MFKFTKNVSVSHRIHSLLRFQNVDPLAIETDSITESTSSQSSLNSNVTVTSVTPTLAKKRKPTNDDDRRACWTALMQSIRPQSSHEEFGSYVSSSLAQIKSDHLINRTKCQIQLVLTKALSEQAELELSTHVQTLLVYDELGNIIPNAHASNENMQADTE